MEHVFIPGDRIAVRKEYLKASEEDISCLRIVNAGLPNEFTVVDTVRAGPAPGVAAIVLSPCCGKLLDPETREPVCAAHPESLFELLTRPEREASAAEKLLEALVRGDPKSFVSINTPFGPLFHLGRYQDGDQDGLVMRVAGAKSFVIAGKDYRKFVDWVKENVL